MAKVTIIDGNDEIELSTAPKENIKAYMVKGEPGSDGTSPTVNVSKNNGVATITITDKDGTKSTSINDGFSPIVDVSKSNRVTTISITDEEGTKTATINDGIDLTGGVPTNGIIGFDITELIYTCDGTETGDYYFTYNNVSYYFTMPTVEDGDILVFNTTNLTLKLDTTTITTSSSGTGTELTFTNNIPNGYEETNEPFPGSGGGSGTVHDSYSTSITEPYSANYVNEHSLTVNETEPTDKTKLWIRDSENLFDKNGDFTYGNSRYQTSLNSNGQLVSTANYGAGRSAGLLIQNLNANTDYIFSGTLISANGTRTPENVIIDVLNTSNSLLYKYSINSSVTKPYNFNFTFNTGENTSIWVSLSGWNTTSSGTTETIFDNIQLRITPSINVLDNGVYNEIYTKDVYSTNEVKTNKTWIDGKPIYRKTYSVGTLPNATVKSVSSGLTNVTVISMYGYGVRPYDNLNIPLPYTVRDYLVGLLYRNSTNSFDINAQGDMSAYTESYITLEYIKTTD